jgi:hypothetical protein
MGEFKRLDTGNILIHPSRRANPTDGIRLDEVPANHFCPGRVIHDDRDVAPRDLALRDLGLPLEELIRLDETALEGEIADARAARQAMDEAIAASLLVLSDIYVDLQALGFCKNGLIDAINFDVETRRRKGLFHSFALS